VLQLAYFSLAQQTDINLLLQPLMKLNSMNGFNPNIASEGSSSPDQVAALGVKTLFLNNCSVMLFLVVAEAVTAGVLYALSHLMKTASAKLSSVSKYLIKEGLLTLMMFNAFNIAFGVGVHFEYADRNNSLYGASTFAALLASGLIFGACALLMFAESKEFGEFKNKLKPNLICQLYFVFSLVYRYVLGYYIAVQTGYAFSSLMVIGFSMAFIGYNLVNLPFKDAYQNYRANSCHLTQLIILIVTNYYQSLLATTAM
jgi:hypothetical protein